MRGLRDVYVLGIGQTKFTKQPQYSAVELGVMAAREAFADAGIDPRTLQVGYTGRIMDGSVTTQAILQHFGVTLIECVNVEDACATGGAAVHQLYKDIAFGIHDIGIAMGVESISNSSIAKGLVPTPKGEFLDLIGHPAIAHIALVSQKLKETRGCTMEDLAYAAYKNHKAALYNPYAHYRKALTMDEIIHSEMIASPVTKLMCCPNSDGAAAIILCTKEIAKQYTNKLIRIAASNLVSGYYSNYDTDFVMDTSLTNLCYMCYEEAGVGPEDLNCVEMHDAYSPEEVFTYEQMGLCEVGETVKLIRSGDLEIGGRCPVNLSGGLLSLGHPLGASGCRVVCDIARQLRGDAPPEVQIKKRHAGLAQMIGGGLYGRVNPEAGFVQILINESE